MTCKAGILLSDSFGVSAGNSSDSALLLQARSKLVRFTYAPSESTFERVYLVTDNTLVDLAPGPSTLRNFARVRRTGTATITVEILDKTLTEVEPIPSEYSLWATSLGPLGTKAPASVYFQGRAADQVGGEEISEILDVGEPFPGMVLLSAKRKDGAISLLRWSSTSGPEDDPWYIYATLPEHTEVKNMLPILDDAGFKGVFFTTESGWGAYTPRFGSCTGSSPMKHIDHAVALDDGSYFIAGPSADDPQQYLSAWLTHE